MSFKIILIDSVCTDLYKLQNIQSGLNHRKIQNVEYYINFQKHSERLGSLKNAKCKLLHRFLKKTLRTSWFIERYNL